VGIARYLTAMGRRLTPTTPGPATDYRIGDFVLRLPAGHRLPEFQAAHRLYDRLPLSLSTLTLHGWIVDIGANVGDTAAALASGQAKSLVCIEPDPAFFVRLKQNTETIKAAGSTIICIEAAVGPAGEKVSLNRTDTTAFVSASEDGGMNLRTLDSILVEAIGDANVALIKCDVDGFDAAALLSGVDVLRRDQPLLQEPARDDDVSLGLRRVVVATRERPGEAPVGAELGVHEHLVLQRRLHVDDRRQRLVVDLDGLEGIRRRVTVTRDDDRHRVADVPHLVDGERRVGRQLHVLGHGPRARQ